MPPGNLANSMFVNQTTISRDGRAERRRCKFGRHHPKFRHCGLKHGMFCCAMSCAYEHLSMNTRRYFPPAPPLAGSGRSCA
jgi:hypothetical protein